MFRRFWGSRRPTPTRRVAIARGALVMGAVSGLLGAFVVPVVPVVPVAAAPAGPTARLAGVVLGAGAPLDGVTVSVTETGVGPDAAPWTAVVTTDANGGFSVLMPERCYEVRFSDPSGAHALASETLCLQGGYDEFLQVEMAPGGAVSGLVTDATTGAPIEGACATLSSASTSVPESRVCTDASGQYRTPGLAPGSYVVYVDDPTGAYESEYFDDAASRQRATTVEVVAGEVRTDVDASLAPVTADTPRIVGTVRGSDTGAPIAACVSVFGLDGQPSSYVCSETGAYASGVLEPGRYVVYFWTVDERYLGEYHRDQVATGDVVTVDVGTVTIDAALTRSASITGRLTGPSGDAAAGAAVRVCRTDMPWDCRTGVADADGTYEIIGLRTGTHLVEFGGADGWVHEWFDDAVDPSAALPVSVTDAQVTPMIDASLGSTAGSLGGRVTDETTGAPVVGAKVAISRFGAAFVTATTTTAADGSWSFPAVAAGDYGVAVTAVGYVSERYDGVVTADGTDTPVPVVAGTATTGIDIALSAEGVIEGTVFAELAPPVGLDLYCVSATRLDGGSFVRSDCARLGSPYRIPKLPAGDYVVRIEGSGVLTEWYQDASSVETAAPVNVAAGAVERVDAAVTRAPLLSGTVRSAVTGEAVPHAWVVLLTSSGEWVANTVADDQGRYALVVPAGAYVVQASGRYGDLTYRAAFHPAAPDLASAAVVQVTGLTDVAAVDVALTPRPTISGRVTDAVTGEPVAGVSVITYAVAGLGASATTAADGTYTIPVDAGTYRVSFTALGYSPEWYANRASYLDATLVSVTDEASATEIDATLDPFGSIVGTVRADVGGAGVSGAAVFVQTPDGMAAGQSTTASDGSYRMPLPAGRYRVNVTAPGYRTEWYDDVPTQFQAQLVEVVGRADTVVDVSLAPDTLVAGTLSSDRGTSLAGNVTAYSTGGWPVAYASVFDGAFRLSLAPGTYLLRFDAPGHAPEWWQDAADMSTATPITLGDGEQRTGLDVVLRSQLAISGTVTAERTGAPASPAQVTVFRQDGSYVTSAMIAGDGRYRVTVDPGTYLFRFDAMYYATEWYEDATNQIDADPVTVSTDLTIDAALPERSHLRGRVVDAATGAAVAATVTAYRADGTFAGNTSSEPGGGSFDLMVDPGTYRLQIQPYSATNVAQWFDGATSFEAATPIPVATGATVEVEVRLAAAPTIRGTVTDAAGNPLSNVYVTAVREGVGFACCATFTDQAGRYVLTGLGTGRFQVSFDDFSGEFVDQWFDGQPTQATATVVELSETSPTATVDASLERWGAIEGRVTVGDGVGLGSGYVQVFRDGQFLTSVGLSPDGSFRVVGLVDGSYQLFAQSWDPAYSSEFYEGAATLPEATPIPVAVGTTVSGIEIRLDPYASISGRITRPDGVGLASVWVRAVDAAGNYVTGTYTDALGDYRLVGLVPGAYRVGTSNFPAEYVDEWYDDVRDLAAATPIVVGSGEQRSGVDLRLSERASISGVVTDAAGQGIGGAQVYASTPSGGSYGYTASDGTFRIAALDAGDYRLFVSDPAGRFVDEWFEDATSFDDATVVVLDEGEAESVSIRLTQRGRISGRVTDAAGKGLSPITVVAQSDVATREATTQGDGTYEISGLPAGSYRISFTDMNGNYVREYHLDAATPDAATLVPVELEQHVTGVDATLAFGAVLTGSVVDPAGATVPWATVSAYDESGAVVGSAFTWYGGTYRIGGLRAGSYRLFVQPSDPLLVATWYDGAGSFETSTPVVVSEASSTQLDLTVRRATTVSGRVTEPGGSGVPFAVVTIGDRSATTDWDGMYTVVGLEPGTYAVKFTDPNNRYAPTFLGGTWDAAASTPITVTEGTQLTGVDQQLFFGAIITGRVTDPQGNPIFAVLAIPEVDVALTSMGGAYVLERVPSPGVTIQVTSDGYEPQDVVVAVPESGEVVRDIVMRPQVDLSVTVDVGPEPVLQGVTTSVTANVANSDAFAVADVAVVVDLPDDVIVDAIDAPVPFLCEAVDGPSSPAQVTCSVTEPMPRNASASIVFVVTPTAPFAGRTVRASVSSATSADLDPSNDTATASMTVLRVGVPDAPTDVRIATAGARAVSVSFAPPAWDGGAAVTRFRVSCVGDHGAARTVTTTGTEVTVGNLTPKATYRCTVVAVNRFGASVASQPSNAVVVLQGGNGRR